ncbi:hypothetical protein J2W35_006483 [Variovorax boronicumulans]|uniref:FliM/FliN family flagellar motor switch protein n=1 Tax=Variovorax boronicumulans TaxID=436515 RepID=UPI002782B173|nr:FliM/FliN family flagellar motor C-terminal domain-containing protein [Variovorax boronicumulans]MDQ0086102.1 hypothetical protein [Variovorax boronicumulans]
MSTSPVLGSAVPALLNPAESLLRARPLRNWQTAQKEAVRTRLAAVYRDWCVEWLPERGIPTTPVDVEVTEPDGTVVMTSDEIACWSFVEAPRRSAALVLDTLARNGRDGTQLALQAIVDRIFAFDMASASSALAAPTIALSVARAAWADWLRRLDALWPGFALEPQQPKGAQGTHAPTNPWSGVLCVCWAWCGGVWHLGLPHHVVTALLGSEGATKSEPVPPAQRPPKERLDQALAAESVALRVVLDGAELNLGQLQELRLDDVVPLTHLLDAPALVMATDGAPVCHGWLGQSEGRLAVELAPHTLNVHPLKENTP